MTSSLSNLFIISHDGGTRCQVMKNFWQGSCPRKINLFMWLAWKNRILTLDNLAIHKCNRLPTTTFAICNSNIEIVNHLFITYPYADRLWNFFGHLFNVTWFPSSLLDVWDSRKTRLPSSKRNTWDSVLHVIVWCIWLERNEK